MTRPLGQLFNLHVCEMATQRFWSYKTIACSVFGHLVQFSPLSVIVVTVLPIGLSTLGRIVYTIY